MILFYYRNGVYADFYYPIYRQLKTTDVADRVLLLFSSANANWNLDKRFIRSDFVPELLVRFVGRSVLVSATTVNQNMLKYPLAKVQIFHGAAGIVSGYGNEFISGFSRLFLTSPHQFEQLTVGEYKDRVQPENLVKVGYPKIDGTVSEPPTEWSRSGSIFYGPTYHVEISSVFEFLEPLVDYARTRSRHLIIKLHPLMYKLHDKNYSGGIDWRRRLSALMRTNANIECLDEHTTFERVRAAFIASDYFVTDTSGIGFEFALVTGRPVVFLGTKLKIPLRDLRAGNHEKYSDGPEIKYRGRLGPLIKTPAELADGLDECDRSYESYVQRVADFRKDFVYNLGNASPVAAAELRKLLEERERSIKLGESSR